MVMAADLVVKAVMTGLIAASLVTWVILVGKVLELSALGLAARRGTVAVATEAGIAGLARRSNLPRPLALMLAEIGEEIAQTGPAIGPGIAGGLVERVRSRLARPASGQAALRDGGRSSASVDRATSMAPSAGRRCRCRSAATARSSASPLAVPRPLPPPPSVFSGASAPSRPCQTPSTHPSRSRFPSSSDESDVAGGGSFGDLPCEKSGISVMQFAFSQYTRRSTPYIEY